MTLATQPRRRLLVAPSIRRAAAALFILLCAALLSPAPARAQTSAADWARVPAILARIVPPVFPPNDFSITNYGAVGDGVTDCTAAISNAIAACNAAGGGRVCIPAGAYLTGAIHLLSNVNLYVATNATIKFNTNPAAYLPLVFTRYQGIECMNYSPFIYAYQQTNIAVTGPGSIDGQANQSGAPWYSWKSLLTADEQALWDMGNTNLPVAQRLFGPGHYLRPYFLEPVHCQNVLLDSVTFLNSPMWSLSPLYCTNVTVHNVTVINGGSSPNTDSCDPDSCTDVLMKNCSFSDGDDCVAIKSGRDADGLRVNIPSQNIVIQNCIFANGHGGVTIGSEESGGVTNVFAENCAFNSANLNTILRCKNNTARGGYVENVYLRNCLGTGGGNGVDLTMSYTSSSPANTGPNTPVIANIDVRDCVFAGLTGKAFSLVGLSSSAPVTGVTVANCLFAGSLSASTFTYTNNITILNDKGSGF
jgi:polygalacturonase